MNSYFRIIWIHISVWIHLSPFVKQAITPQKWNSEKSLKTDMKYIEKFWNHSFNIVVDFWRIIVKIPYHPIIFWTLNTTIIVPFIKVLVTNVQALFQNVSLIFSFEARDVVCNACWASLSNMVIRLLLPLAIFNRLVLVFELEWHPIVPLMLLFFDSTGDVDAAWCVNETWSLTWWAMYCCFSFMTTWKFLTAEIHSTDKIARATSVCNISVNKTCDLSYWACVW